jgi:site-specific DNA recombinase
MDVLVTREIDRLSRKLAKQLVTEEELKRANAEIDYVLGEYPDTPEGRLNKHIRATIAEFEREKIKERMVRGRQLKVKQGSVMVYGKPPYGYRLKEQDGKQTLEIYEPEARIVRLIFQWCAEGDTLARIVQRLNEMQVLTSVDAGVCKRPKKKQRGEWVRPTVHRMLRNETYAGIWYYLKRTRRNGKLVKNTADNLIAVEVPAIVDIETWETAQEVLTHNRVKNVGRRTRYEYLLYKRTVCGVCGLRVQAKAAPKAGGKVYLYYYCPANADCVYPCDLPCFRADWVDAAVWAWVKSFLSDPAALTKGLDEYQAGRDKENEPLRARLRVVNDLLADNRAQLERLLDLYLAGAFPKEMLTERKARLETTIAALERERDALAVQIEERTLTGEQVQTLQEFAARVAEGLADADGDFATRRGIIEDLDVCVTLAVEGGQKVVYARCMLGKDVLPIDKHHLA